MKNHRIEITEHESISFPQKKRGRNKGNGKKLKKQQKP